MVTRARLGEFEQRVLLAVLRSGEDPTTLEVRRELERVLGRDVSRGAFYTTLERLEAKGHLTWSIGHGRSTRGRSPERHLEVTRQGKQDLRIARQSLLDLWSGLEELFDEGGK